MLTGRIALVTGAGKGIGKAIAESLHANGAQIIAVARTKSDLDDLAVELGERVECWPLDVTGDELVERITGLDRLDILVNNAGGNRPEPMVDVSDENLDFILNLNVRSAYRISRSAAQVMIRQSSGAIVQMSSQMGHVGSPGRTVYCMTKHAIEGLTKAMAVELAPHGIRVNSVAPTFISTPMTEPMFEKPEFKEFVMRMIPLRKIGKPEDVAEAVLYLASDRSAMITGHSLVVDGGWTAQ
jgi:NAD(P)-dependent dehydrogenase (short-subunit alcohol dehydrogenase family)